MLNSKMYNIMSKYFVHGFSSNEKMQGQLLNIIVRT